MEEMNQEQLVREIGQLEQDIEQKKQELAEVQAKLGGPAETGKPPVDEEQPASNGENTGDEATQLKQREQELVSQITAEQMRLVALKKQLESMNGDEMVANMSKED